MSLGKVCEHGSLGRQCYICELENDNKKLLVRLKAAEAVCKGYRNQKINGKQLDELWFAWRKILRDEKEIKNEIAVN